MTNLTITKDKNREGGSYSPARQYRRVDVRFTSQRNCGAHAAMHDGDFEDVQDIVEEFEEID